MKSAESGQLLYLNKGENYVSLTQFDGKQIKKIISNYNKSVVIDSTNNLFWIENSEINDDLNKFMKQVRVKDIAFGKNYSIILDIYGYMYAWGENSVGQLGLGHCDNILEPELIRTMKKLKVAQIACGDCHSACITGIDFYSVH